MKRGEVWWATFEEPVGRRPVVLVSREEAYAVRAKVIVLEITTVSRGLATEVRLDATDGLPRACVANADNVATIPRTLLKRRIGLLPIAKRRALDAALKFAMGLD